ncbi:electron transport complex subunit RsxC [Parasulfuritortus cantonensis]|uniref:Ion-translocating oxidoreductase complex subunit C n=1 Tax=Parasulfuritortus cantonensis TaxID=2528202 RepID=A0A4R1BFA3_9PROT|nr:electron transport complex subunit RsxC [Parasulfuritortus cantonensis]TCJ15803.1 electron transport complex subunit RsxC [Parasulfuritortus cantonensis]
MSLLSIFRRKTFARGVHPASNKSTAGTPLRRLPFAPRMILPLAQHIGKPAVPIVAVGQEVVRGQLIARAEGFLSVPIHAPVDGVVEAIELRPSARGPWTESIVIRTYEASTQEVRWGTPRDMDALSAQEIIQAVQDSGMVGLGGAAFPSHAKLTVPKGRKIHTLVVNGCECEPYLTCDHRVMLERTDDLMLGIRYAMRAVGAEKAVIGIEDNKPDAVEAVRAALPADGSIAVAAVETKYPQGAEKMLIKSALGLEVPAGGLPSEVGVVVNNVGTLALLGRLLPLGQGLTERAVTLTGPGIKRPGDYWVPIGTPLRHVLEWAGAEDVSEREIILGGPMMGQAIASLDVPITKGVSGILVFDRRAVKAESDRSSYACIKCGECVQACPMGLNPSMLGLLAGSSEYELMGSRYHLGDCFECGCCTYVCPSNIPLVQQFRAAKSVLRQRAEIAKAKIEIHESGERFDFGHAEGEERKTGGRRHPVPETKG